MTTLSDIIGKSLGSQNSYATFTDNFDASLLNQIPREMVRDSANISSEGFSGFDLWNSHESSFLLSNGYPVSGTLRIIYDCRSEYMVESKSLKLYLNSFDMAIMGDTIVEASNNYVNQISSDLSKVLNCSVKVSFFDDKKWNAANKVNFGEGYSCIDSDVDKIERKVVNYHGEKGILQLGGEGSISLKTNLLRSRCRHTKQKDTGTAFIKLVPSSHQRPSSTNLIEYIISLREVEEFHEFCAEKIFNDLYEIMPENSKIMVALFYNRRGGIDINPIRMNGNLEWVDSLLDMNKVVLKTQGQ